MNSKVSHFLRQLIVVLFLLSGCAGLVYEIVWAKMFTLVLGSDAEAQALVLGVFLGGLALGYKLFGKIVDRTSSTLRVYAWLELAIALWAMISLSLYDICSAFYRELAAAHELNSPKIFIAKIAIVSIIVLPLTTCMGGTLPALVKWATSKIEDIEKSLSFLYFINSLGAVIGTVVAGYYLIATYGLDLSISLAALLNLVIGFIALLLNRTEIEITPPNKESLESEPHQPSAPTQKLKRSFLIAAFLIGLTTLSFEVAWARLLILVVGGSTYSFTIMLAAFISGIALGAWVLSRGFFENVASIKRFVLCEFLLVSTILCTLPLYQYLPYVFYRLNSMFSHSANAFYIFEATKFCFAFLLMLAPTFLIGMALPLLTSAVTEDVSELGEKLGGIFAANTVGNLCGAIGAGLLFLPLLGIKGLLETMTFVNLGVALWFLFAFVPWPKKTKLVCSTVFVLVPTIYFITNPAWDNVLLSAGSYRLQNRSAMSYSDFSRNMTQGKKLIFHKNDRVGSVSVMDYNYPEGDISLAVNGKPEASASKNSDQSLDMANQILAGHVPLLLHPQAKSILNIGLGSGITDGAILSHPIEKLDALEISPAVAEAAELFAEYNGHALSDKRVSVFVRDAKSFITFSPSTYDIMISEPSNPWVSGVASLFTFEFYENAKAKLNTHGLFAQHLHGYEMNEKTLSLILRTFLKVFPDALLFSTQVNDYLLVGAKEAFNINFDAMQARFNEPQIKESLARIKITKLSTLLSTQIANNEVLHEIAKSGDINEDRFPTLEYEAPKAYFMKSTIQSLMDKDLRLNPRSNESLLIQTYLEAEQRQLNTSEFSNLNKFHQRWSPRPVSNAITLSWLNQFPSDLNALKSAWKVVEADKNVHKMKPISQTLGTTTSEDKKRLETIHNLTMKNFRNRLSPWLNNKFSDRLFLSLAPKTQWAPLDIGIQVALYEYWDTFPASQSSHIHFEAAQKLLTEFETLNPNSPAPNTQAIEKLRKLLSQKKSPTKDSAN